MISVQQARQRRHRRQRMKIKGTKACPRLAVFRSNKHISAQLIDDDAGQTLVAASDVGLKSKMNKMKKAQAVGKLLCEKALQANINRVVFDRGGFAYHGRLKALAEAARGAGLVF